MAVIKFATDYPIDFRKKTGYACNVWLDAGYEYPVLIEKYGGNKKFSGEIPLKIHEAEALYEALGKLLDK